MTSHVIRDRSSSTARTASVAIVRRLMTAVRRAILPATARDRHLGGDMREPDAGSFEPLQALLRAADTWPSGATGTQIRRAACDLIESDSAMGRALARYRLRACVACVRRRKAHGRPLAGDPTTRLVDDLTTALSAEGAHARTARDSKAPA